jgi:NAD(P)-dependent dehydrogenase (short-subunit alcohol dehydrogenase family)
MNKPNALIFGASGSIGQALCASFASKYDVLGVARHRVEGQDQIESCWDMSKDDLDVPTRFQKFDAVVWAQGANCNDDIRTFDLKTHEGLYAANVTYILTSLQMLLRKDLLSAGARLCIISSIWQNIARQNKLSYCITKSALQGMVRSLSVDLGIEGVLVNAVLPGALDTPMTHANLSPDQIARLEALTPLGTLAKLSDVCNLVAYLCSPENTGITGQFIEADRGFSHARII